MPTIVTMFSEIDPLQEARTALEEAGFGEDVQWVLDASTLDRAQKDVTAGGSRTDGTLLGQGRTTPAGAAGPLDDLNLGREETEFIRSSVADGARVLVVETDRPAEAREILASRAQRIIETD